MYKRQNLASKEYSKAIEKYLTSRDGFITVEFCQLKDGKLKQKATLAKMARGEMVRFMAENKIQEPEGIKEFHELGFAYKKELSNDKKYIFVCQN